MSSIVSKNIYDEHSANKRAHKKLGVQTFVSDSKYKQHCLTERLTEVIIFKIWVTELQNSYVKLIKKSFIQIIQYKFSAINDGGKFVII